MGINRFLDAGSATGVLASVAKGFGIDRLVTKLLYREQLREAPVIDVHRFTADLAIHIQIIVTHHGQSFKTPPADQTYTREASAAPAA